MLVVKCFYAEWEKESLEQKAELEELKEEFSEVEFKMLDVEIYREMTSKSKIHTLPTILIEKDGEPLKKFVGRISKDVLRNTIKKYLE
ncbi:MAG: thiol reductase thioredoxin [Archaeoglobi archaeon]|nr:thiol reductase thioredoxin [Candidatus Mnemosynella sp.]